MRQPDSSLEPPRLGAAANPGPLGAKEAGTASGVDGELILTAAGDYLLAPLLAELGDAGHGVVPFEGNPLHLLELAAGWRTAILAEWERLAPAAKALESRPRGRLLVIGFVPWWSEDEEAARRACDLVVHDTAEPDELAAAAGALRRFFSVAAAA